MKAILNAVNTQKRIKKIQFGGTLEQPAQSEEVQNFVTDGDVIDLFIPNCVTALSIFLTNNPNKKQSLSFLKTFPPLKSLKLIGVC